jgi:hypothetical protein
MSAAAHYQSTARTAQRVEPRQRVVHVVEYSRYPRRAANETRRVAYTQDLSRTGLGLDLRERVAPGELLRVILREIDGTPLVDGLARVVWSSDLKEGRARAGVEILRETGERTMLRVRPRAKDQVTERGPAYGSH